MADDHTETTAPSDLPKPELKKPPTDRHGFYVNPDDALVNDLKANEALRTSQPISADLYKRAWPGVKLIMERLMEIQGKGERFAFLDFSGHVDWISISVTVDRGSFNRKAFERTLYLPGSLNGSVNIEDFNKLVEETLERLHSYA